MVKFAAKSMVQIHHCFFAAFAFMETRKVVVMAEDIRDEEIENEDVENEDSENNENDDEREEETVDEIRDNAYANDDIIEMIKSMEKRFDAFDEKLDNAISMMVDSGAMVHDMADESERESVEDFEDDFINIDELDLAL